MVRIPAPALGRPHTRHAHAPAPRRTGGAVGREAAVRRHLPPDRGRMSGDFPLVLISAWNDSGGGFTHLLFDGHPGFFVWAFSLHLGAGDRPDVVPDWFCEK